MDFEERIYEFGKGSYIEREGALLVWFFSMMVHLYRWKIDGFEITWPSQPSKGMYNVQKLILLFFYIFYHTS